MKEPNPLSVKKKKKPNMTAPKKTASSTGKSKEDQSQSGSKAAGETVSEDPTKGKTRVQGDGTSKKALKRKAKRAAKE